MPRAYTTPGKVMQGGHQRSRRGIVIAIDGPAGAGKSSVARALAARLGFKYVNTGAMYRAVGWLVSGRTGSVQDGTQVAALLKKCRLQMIPGVRGSAGSIRVNGKDVTRELQSAEAGRWASVISTKPEVRETLVAMQKRMAYHPGVIMEGRDISTVVFPDAEVKVYLTASVAERARRRARQLSVGNRRVSIHRIEREIRSRDRRDRSRRVAPLRKTRGGVVMDTTGISEKAAVDRLEQLVRARLPRLGGV